MITTLSFIKTMNKFIFVDTSAWYAYVNAKDPGHRLISSLLENSDGLLVTTNFIFDETITLVRMRFGYRAAIDVGETLLNPNNVLMEKITGKDEKLAWQLFSVRKDQSYSFTDCTSFILMKRLKITHAIALDKHFSIEGFIVQP